jgi:DNA-binding XRE family transcriptional regulator
MKLSLKACRVNVEATAKEMAAAIGVCEDTIYNWESGKCSPRSKELPKILAFFASRGFDVSVNQIKFLG